MSPINSLKNFLKQEGSSGIVLIIAALGGMIVANSPLKDIYNRALSADFTIDISFFYLSLTTAKIINYLLMSLFFLVVGMEIKRELISGHLSGLKKATAPFAAALGGMLIPALIYLIIVNEEGKIGWAIPVATDIALAIGVLTLMGDRVSLAMKAFLLALAVIDDIGAIAIIAIFYSKNVDIKWVILGLLMSGIIYFLFKSGIKSKLFFALSAFLLWYSFYRAGVHPTLAGVLLGFVMPTSESLEDRLHPWSSYLVVPLFAFANTGVEISKSAIADALNSTIALGIFLGMVIGKPLGIYLFTMIAVIFKLAEKPEAHSNLSMIATGSAAGIGFTVAIFIAELAFTDAKLQALAIIAVIFSSLLSGLISVMLHSLGKSEASN